MTILAQQTSELSDREAPSADHPKLTWEASDQVPDRKKGEGPRAGDHRRRIGRWHRVDCGNRQSKSYATLANARAWKAA
jgi:hypothetical protein